LLTTYTSYAIHFSLKKKAQEVPRKK